MRKPIYASTYDSDKSQSPHYLRNYEQWFESIWDQPITLLEIGVHRGGSLLLWRDYFEKGIIIGLDIAPIQISDDTGRIRVYRGQQQDTQLLDRIATETAPDGFDVVIDDGSHIGRLSHTTFWHLFDHHLKAGGLYVIEDWGTGYWQRWPDGASYRFNAGSVPHAGRRIGRDLFRRNPGRWKPASHVHGMVGFVKQLVDECGVADSTHPEFGVGNHRRSKFDHLVITHGQVLVQKARPE